MVSFFRSERMFLYTIILHPDSGFDCVVELGNVGCAQFLNVYDGNVTPNLKYTQYVERCTEMLRIIQILQDQIDDMKMQAFYYPNVDRDEIPRENDLQSIENVLNSLEQELFEVSRHCDALQKRILLLNEHRRVLWQTQEFLTGSRNTEAQITSYESLDTDLLYDSSAGRDKKSDQAGPLRFITGCLPLKSFHAFEIMIWRISRGNAYVKHAQFELPEDLAKKMGESSLKVAFIIVFVGAQLESKLLKISEGFHAKIFPCPETQKERLQVLQKLNRDLHDLEGVFKQSQEHKRRILSVAAVDLYIWRSKVRKMLEVYFVLNRLGKVKELKRLNKYLQVDCWIPEHCLKVVRAAVNRGALRAAENDPTQMFPPILHERAFSDKIKPPTFFPTNKFTYGFQNLIDAYGIASYREINPGPFTIVTFPFLFAVMFGDTGHGLLLTLFAYTLIYREKKIQREQKEAIKVSEIFDLIFAGRYILLLMGIFSIYTGFIYNDNFSKTINLFGSSWRVNFTALDWENNKIFELDPAREDNYRGIPYLMGVDPIWNSVAENAIIVSNSFKMKVSIILGVCQMIFGLVLSASNATYTKSKIDFYFVFLPQIIFFVSLFFYLIFLIFFKWCMYGGHLDLDQSSSCAPSILITFINMILFKSAEEPHEGCNKHMFTGQAALQRFLVFVAFISVPVLLCGKPIHFMLQHKRMTKIKDPERKERVRRTTMESIRKSLIYSVDELPTHRNDDQEEQLSEVWIHSGIHTIECVLGSVSHTASYLRLWALSLAHAQLSDVLWKMILQKSLKCRLNYLNSIFIYATFAIFACLTVSILVIMEGLSAFLHTLRLHWVEFQSKFYKGTGEPFTPFRFKPSSKIDALSKEKRDFN